MNVSIVCSAATVACFTRSTSQAIVIAIVCSSISAKRALGLINSIKLIIDVLSYAIVYITIVLRTLLVDCYRLTKQLVPIHRTCLCMRMGRSQCVQEHHMRQEVSFRGCIMRPHQYSASSASGSAPVAKHRPVQRLDPHVTDV
jgi:hypothetical protein